MDTQIQLKKIVIALDLCVKFGKPKWACCPLPHDWYLPLVFGSLCIYCVNNNRRKCFTSYERINTLLNANTVVNTYASFMSDIKEQKAKGRIEMLLNYKNPVEFINTYGRLTVV